MKKTKPRNDGKIIDINRREKRLRKKRAAKIRFICILAVVAVICFLMTPVFNIRNMEVTGNSIIKDEEIIKASGIDYNQNLFRMNVKKSKDAIRAIPYVENVNIIRKLSGRVVFKVTERQPVACIKYANGYVLIDKDGRLLEAVSERKDYPEIVGITLSKQKPGDILKDSVPQQIEAMDELLALLKEHDLLSRTSQVNIKNADNVTFVVDDNKTVKTGGNYRLDYKLMMLEATINELAKSEEGTIDLSVEGQALFTPLEE